jgi:hypothetical protein
MTISAPDTCADSGAVGGECTGVCTWHFGNFGVVSAQAGSRTR